MKEKNRTCPICYGSIEEGVTIFTVKAGDCILVLENVPASLCTVCGEKWFSDEVVEKIEEIATSVRTSNIRFEVRSFSAA